MACKDDSTLEALRNMTQCSICIETFNDPRVLPCAHFFCLKCLEKTQSKTKANCALCRKPFNIPVEGLSGLPKNTTIQNIIELSKEPKSSGNPETVKEKQTSIGKTAQPEESSENIGSAGAQLLTDALHCGNCNNCEHCSREGPQDPPSNEEPQKGVTLDDQMIEGSTETAEIPDSEETESLCDVCVLNNSDGKQKQSTATLYCMDCNENQCEKCSAEHMRQRLCKQHTVVSLEDHLKEKLKQKEEPETTIFCDVCIDNNETGTASVAIATLHCIDCTENQCEDCSKEHKRQRLCKDHQIVVLDDQLKSEHIKMKAMAKSTDEDILCDVCAESSDDIKISATWHCTDCNENQCDGCNREHKRQRSLKSHQCEVLNDQLKEKLLKAKLMATSSEIKVFCDICKEDKEIEKKDIVATHYCSECKENQCEDCNREHKRQRLFKTHQIIAIDAQMKGQLLNSKELDKKPDLEIICEICAENSESGETWSAASLHCLECDENHCENCSKEHKKQSFFRSHEIVPIDQKSSIGLSELKAEVDTLCDMCAGYYNDQTEKILKATRYCVDCQENQCEECNRSHLKQKLFREHQVIALNALMQQHETYPRTCSIHVKDKLKFYCFTCHQVVCMKCVDKEHNSHESQFACTVVDDFRNEIEDYLENVDSWLQQGEAIKHELQTKYLKTEHVRNMSRKGELSFVSEDLHSSKEHKLNMGVELKKELDEHLASLSAFKRRCCGLKAHKSSLSICLVMNELRTKFEELRRQQELFSRERLLPCHASSFADFKSSDPKSPYYGFRQQMKKIAEEELTSMLTDEAYSKIRKIIGRPLIKEGDIHQLWRVAFPYIIQRMRMWNGYVLTAPNIAELIIPKQKQKQKEVAAESCSFSSTKTIQKMKTNDMSVYPVSRLDCLTYLINIADCIVAHDILRIMSKFPMAIPLIIQDILEDDKYIVTVPIMQNTVIKWESTPGQIVENHLFTSPFRMVAAIRLGTNKIGKSTILNQLMNTPFMFSSKGEAGSRYGRPCTIDGAVEIVWLTQETCSSSTWKMMREYYRGNTEEVAILANLHGSALHHQETLKYLEKHVCSFIVFLMPDSTEKELNQLKQCIKSKQIIQVLVDPQDNLDEESYMNTIRTDSLSSDDTLQTLRLLLRENLNSCSKAESESIEEACQQYESIKYTKPLHCKKSAEIVEIVRNHGCLNIKQLLSSADIKSNSAWNYNLKRLIKLFLEIISLQKRDAKKCLTYVETNLSQISASESIAARSEVSEANKGLRCIVPAPPKAGNGGNSEDKQIETDLKKAQQRLKAAMDKVDNTNLGQEHFFRTLGHLYENSFEVSDLGDLTAVRDLPNHFADLLINGHAIEMLNGDSGKMQLTWIKAICDSVLKKLPNLKVFVISIIGLQSSGKSTLLNALFSCRFAVSVGRCSRGLFMRMIFLDNTLSSSHGFDAIILIDTEGLSSPEKMNDPKANQKDRLMATYAMGISNLTIVNILGEGMTEMTEILQIAIVAMARLRGGGIKPDILMIQHLQERNVSKIDQAKGQFCEAINKAFDLISKNDVEIGLASAECLAELTTRIHSGDLFQHFGPFKDGSSVNSPPSESYHEDIVSLLKTILKRTAVSENKTSFERWCNHFETYWTCVQEENFALNFKNVKHITDFLYFEKKISKVRELLDRSIRSHREMFSKNIREQVGSQVAEKKNRPTQTDSKHRKRLLDDIKQQLQLIPHSCPGNCGACRQFSDSHVALLEELSSSEWIEDTKRSFEKQKTRLHEITMSMLGQTFDGSLVRQGCFSEFSVIIANELNDALRKRPTGIYSPEEQKNITKNIWEHLQKHAAGMEDESNLDEKINQALRREYSGVLPTIIKDFKIDMTYENLASSRAIKSFWSMIRHLNYKLSEDQMNSLINTIDQLIESVFEKRCSTFSKTGLDFEEGMVGDIRAAFPDAIKRFENRFHMNLEGMFKMKLQIYALQHFRRTMMDLQKIWDSQNKPREILQQKKQDYISEIETTLKSGFSSAGEGEVVATKLYNAMKKKALQTGYDEKVRFIKDMSWTTNSEKVRLCYFEELAKEVAAGMKKRALRHFQNPKVEIQKWYKERVDSFDANDKVMNIYYSTLKTELKRLLQKISNSTTEAEINRIVEVNIKAGDDQYYSKLDPKDYDFEKLKESIERKLQAFCEVKDRESVVFPLSSDDSEIMGRLGCTEHCFWCGALCWGSRDHQLEKDRCPELETHHSCHQPSGLIGVRDRSSMILRSGACHNRPDDAYVYFQDCEEENGILWSKAKRDHFSDWKFDVHCITTFDELMRWFFQELHNDIAKGRLALPAAEKDLRENKCKNLKLREILKAVQNKI